MSQGNAGDKVTPNIVAGRKVNSGGTVIASKVYDTRQSALNVYEFFQSGSSLAWDTTSNHLGWMLSRTMTKSGDGLNHQGCIAIIIDGNTLDIIANKGQTSGHSFNNFIDVDGTSSNGDFVAVDLGDNFPRGINVHKLSASSKIGKVGTF